MSWQKNSRKLPQLTTSGKKRSMLSGVRVARLQHLRKLGHLHLAAFAHAWLLVISVIARVLDHIFAVESLFQPTQRPVQCLAFSDAYFSQIRFTSFPEAGRQKRYLPPTAGRRLVPVLAADNLEYWDNMTHLESAALRLWKTSEKLSNTCLKNTFLG